MRRLSDLREQVSTWQGMAQRVKDALDLVEMAAEEEDDSLLTELTTEVESLEETLDRLEFQLVLSGEHDKDAALLSIHAGAGGTESQDWAEMLMRMYYRERILDCLEEMYDFRTVLLDAAEKLFASQPTVSPATTTGCLSVSSPGSAGRPTTSTPSAVCV